VALLTAAERSFLGVLDQAVGDDYRKSETASAAGDSSLSEMRSSNAASARDNRKQYWQRILGLQNLSQVPRHSVTAPVPDEASPGVFETIVGRGAPN
jgi:hypothetical protein